jgi:uncharacterized spore protein YtfJ
MASVNQETKPALDKPAPNGRYFETIAKKLGVNSNIGLVYGEPVERQGITVIPVANFFGGFGGGESSETQKVPGGTGGGAGFIARPVGYIEIKNGQAKFQPVVDVVGMVRTVFTFVAIIMFIGSTIRKRRAKLEAKATKTEAKLPKEGHDTFNFGLLNVVSRTQVRPGSHGKARQDPPKIAEAS